MALVDDYKDIASRVKPEAKREYSGASLLCPRCGGLGRVRVRDIWGDGFEDCPDCTKPCM